MFQADLLLLRPILGEAAPRGDLAKVIARLRRHERWSKKGLPKSQIIEEIDDDFIRHRVHYTRMMHGGKDDNGKKFRAATGIKSVNFRATTNEAEVVIDGSREWDKSPHQYSTRIKFSNYNLIREAAGMSWLDKARLLLEDNVRVDCDCAAFAYYYRWAANKRGFAIVTERRPAKIRNPGKRGSVCKHLEHALHYLGGSYSTIASAMKKHHEYLSEHAMTEPAVIKSITTGTLRENVNDFGMVDVLNGLMLQAGKRGMGRTAQALRVAISEAQVEGAPALSKTKSPDMVDVPPITPAK